MFETTDIKFLLAGEFRTNLNGLFREFYAKKMTGMGKNSAALTFMLPFDLKSWLKCRQVKT